MKWSLFVCLFAILSRVASAVVFLSSSGMETYETNIILEPKNNEELKSLLQNAHDRNQRLALGGAGYKLNDQHHFQGVSFGAHAYGVNGQPRLSTQFLQKAKLMRGDFELDRGKNLALVRVKGGNTQGQILAMANEALPPDLREKYEFFLPGPSTEYITIGGAMAAHTHYRSTYPWAGFISDQVENFTLVAIQDGVATEIFCSRQENADLFHAIPGSFGRGGVITDVTLRLQLVPKNYRPTTAMRVYDKLGDYQRAYAAWVERLKSPGHVGTHNKAFLGVNGFITDNRFYIFTFDLEPLEKVKDLPQLDLFKTPDSLTQVGHYGLHANWPGLHWFANAVTENWVLWGNNTRYQNDLIPWLFFHNGFLKFRDSFDAAKASIVVQAPRAVLGEIVNQNRAETVFGRNMQTAHQGYVVKLADYERFMKDYMNLQAQYPSMKFKFRDFDPVPSSRTVMSPAYSEDTDEVFVVATLSWPVNNASDKEAIDALKKDITSLKYVRVHPHKEFDSESDLLRTSYGEQAQRFEQILKANRIDDRVLWTKMHKALYGKE